MEGSRTFMLFPSGPQPIRGLKPGKREAVTVSPTGVVTMKRVLGAWRLLGVEWGGPRLAQQTVTEQRGETRRRGRVVGAVVGTAIAPGIGTAIGAGLGTGNKRHEGASVSTTRTVEEPSVLVAIMADLETGWALRVSFAGTSADLGPFAEWCSAALRRRRMEGAPVAQALPVAQKVADPYDEVLKLKRLLDAGAVTQEEFDRKKAQLLGL